MDATPRMIREETETALGDHMKLTAALKAVLI